MNVQENQSNYSRSLMWAVAQTGLVALAAGIVFDGGRTLGATIVALLGYWMVAIAIWLRHGEVQQHEVIFARYGILAILFTAIAAVFIRGLFV